MRARIPAFLIAGLLLGLLLAPAPAAAHSFLREAKPGVDAVVKRSPKRIALWFNEPIEAEFAKIVVTTRKGRRVRAAQPAPVDGTDDALTLRLHRKLPAGRYAVTWRVVSADAHIQSGEFAFRVKLPAKAERERKPDRKPEREAAPLPAGDDMQPPADTGPMTSPEGAGAAGDPMAEGQSHSIRLVAIARGFTTAGLLLLVGLVVFWLLAWRGTGAALAPPSDVQRAFLHRWQRLASIALAVTVIGTLAGVVTQGAAAAGVPIAGGLRPDIIEAVLSTDFGKAAVGRLVALELLIVLAVLWRVLPLFTAPRPTRAVGAAALDRGVGTQRLLLVIVAVLPLLLTMSIISHAAGASPLGLHLAADAVHLAAAGAWIGGVLVLAVAVFPAAKGLDAAERVRVLGPPIVRFSRIAAVSVALVIVTGTFRGVSALGGWDGLTGTAYGTALLIKLGVFTGLLGLGAFNHLWAVRRIRAAAAAGSHTSALQALRRTVTVETGLAVVIVVTTAVLVSLPMPTA